MPGAAKTGRVSPVSSDRSSSELPARISPSTGIPAAGPHQDDVANRKRAQRHLGLFAVAQAGGAGHLQRRQLLGGRPGDGAGAVIEIAAGQQKEGQRDGGVEIGVVAREPCLPERGCERQRNGQRNRHIHVEPPGAECTPGADKERLGGKADGGQGDHRRNPVKHVACRTLGPGPDSDREQHHVHRRKARHRQPHQQVAPDLVGCGGAEQPGVELMRLKARHPPAPGSARRG